MTEDTGCLLALVVSLGGLTAIGVGFYSIYSRNLQRQRRNGDIFRNAARELGEDPINRLNNIIDISVRIPRNSFVWLLGETHLLNEIRRLSPVYWENEPGRACLAKFFHQLGPWVSAAAPSTCAAIAVEIFYNKPDQWESHEYALGILRSMVGMPANLSDWIYRTTLDLLEENPESSACCRLGLEVGRWHFGRSREDGNPTIYDEQAIQNDLMVRAI